MQSLSITLPHDMVQMVKSKVKSGEYATESEVIRDGLQALTARENAGEKWLRDEVVATYDSVLADPESTTMSTQDAWAAIKAHAVSRSATPPKT
jgi:antitoxin ParD1/3/4